MLRGVGGAVVTAPFLGSVWERAGRAASGPASPANPKQLIVMFTHYGCITNSFFPVKSHGTLAASDLSPTLLPLAPYVGKLLIPRGIRAMNEWTKDNDGTNGLGQGNDAHTQVVGSYFTCQPVTPNSNDPFSFDMSTKFNAKPIASSLDHVMAQQISPSGTPLFMRVGNSGGTNGESPQSNVTYLLPAGAAPGTAADIYPGLGKPSQVYSLLTGLFQTGTSMSPADYAAVKGQSIIDLVKDDLDTLERFDMSQADRNKLEAWKALLADVAHPVAAAAQCTQANADALGASQANVSAFDSGVLGADALTSMVTSSLDGADMYSAMAVLSAMCNYNPVIVLKYPPNYTFSGLGITEESASLSHRLDNAGLSGVCYPNAIEMISKIDAYYAQKFAKLVGMLDGITNPDGSTLLDSSAAVWFNEMSDGLAMNLNNLPIVQAGNCGGYFKTGWTINVDPGNPGAPDLTQGNSTSQCNGASDQDASAQMANGIDKGTGTDPSIANAPINKYFCNLMNALGVKAGADGFPVVFGTAPVTCFGYSDKTQDFCGGAGAVAGATIHSPGEFSELRA
ncbi:MAG: DUF1552 domain-containing protein [Polyangiaceae bacterium]|nr:DUF1552 domain-containing protein [Polyangiaceae bacterium]